MRILPTVLKSLFRKPFTRRYPKVKAEPPQGFRGKHVYDRKKCIGCKACVRNCPAKAIVFLSDSKKVEFDLTKCVYCGVCEDVCPVKCIKLSNEIVLAQSDNKLVVK